MNFELVLANFLNPPVLFFFLGLGAILLRAGLEIPQPLPKFFSLYLLLSIGFKGGAELREGGFSGEVLTTLGAATFMAGAIPLWMFFALRKRLGAENGAAVAATYGSVSVVTFVAALAFLNNLKIESSGHMVAAMALMESPAIIIGVALARRFGENLGEKLNWGEVLRDAFLNGSVYVLCGSFLVGLLVSHESAQSLEPFTGQVFKGILCLFLLEMGMVCGQKLGSLKELGVSTALFAFVSPLINGTLGLLIAKGLGMSLGDAFLFTVLCASASYIAVPAAMRLAVPRANPGVYVSMALALTFPFNIVLGLPLYMWAVNFFWK